MHTHLWNMLYATSQLPVGITYHLEYVSHWIQRNVLHIWINHWLARRLYRWLLGYGDRYYDWSDYDAVILDLGWHFITAGYTAYRQGSVRFWMQVGPFTLDFNSNRFCEE